MSAVRKLRKRRAVPLRVGDVWVLIGPATEERITALSPRPTAQKPKAQEVTLDGCHVITEATLRFAYMRKQEYLRWTGQVAVKFEAAKAEFFGEPIPTAKVLRFPRPTPGERNATNELPEQEAAN